MKHLLNTSTSKQAHTFSRSQRFKDNKSETDLKYNVPTTFSKRTCSFGYGNKQLFDTTSRSPPPGTYQAPSQFSTTAKARAASSFGKGRDSVIFGSPLYEMKNSQANPSPGAYTLQNQKSKIGGQIRSKLQSQSEFENPKKRGKTPGPGQYSFRITQMSHKSLLSNFRNNASPKITRYKTQKEQDQLARQLSPTKYNPEQKIFGKYVPSKFENMKSFTFSKVKRRGIIDRTKQYVPGYKYKVFSEFQSIQ